MRPTRRAEARAASESPAAPTSSGVDAPTRSPGGRLMPPAVCPQCGSDISRQKCPNCGRYPFPPTIPVLATVGRRQGLSCTGELPSTLSLLGACR